MLWQYRTGSSRTDLPREAEMHLAAVFQMDPELLALDDIGVRRGRANGWNRAWSARRRRGQAR